MSDDDKRRALRHAIELMKDRHKRVPMSFGGCLPEDIAALEDLLVDIRQLPLPLMLDAGLEASLYSEVLPLLKDA